MYCKQGDKYYKKDQINSNLELQVILEELIQKVKTYYSSTISLDFKIHLKSRFNHLTNANVEYV